MHDHVAQQRGRKLRERTHHGVVMSGRPKPSGPEPVPQHFGIDRHGRARDDVADDPVNPVGVERLANIPLGRVEVFVGAKFADKVESVGQRVAPTRVAEAAERVSGRIAAALAGEPAGGQGGSGHAHG